MRVKVELEYQTVPSEEELATIRDAGRRLTTNPKSVWVRLTETEKCPLVILEFEMKNQAQYKVVGEISNETQIGLMGPLNDITISFP